MIVDFVVYCVWFGEGNLVVINDCDLVNVVGLCGCFFCMGVCLGLGGFWSLCYDDVFLERI